MAKRDTKVGDLCRKLGITRQTRIGSSIPRASCALTTPSC